MNKFLSLLIVALMAILVTSCVPAPSVPTPAPTAPTSVAQPPTTPVPAPGGLPTPDARPTVPPPPADGSRPLAKLSPIERNERFSGPAAPYTKPGVLYIATFVTDKGNIVAELYPDAVQSVNNFVTLAKGGFYDGLTFHRVEPGFVIQGGDPKGEGAGGPGYTIPAEINHTHPRGALAWARTGDQFNPERRSSGSQFYITLDETPFLDGQYTVFGLVVEGMEVADQIEVGDKINRIDVTEATVSRLPTPTPTPVPKAPVLEPGRPLAAIPFEQREGIYNTPPAMTIDTAKSYRATIEGPQGQIVIELDAKAAPEFVNNFVVLANLGFYDGMPVAFVQPRADDPELPALAILGSPGSNQESDVGYILDVGTNVTGLMTGTVSMYPVVNPYTGEFLGASGSQFFLSFVEMPDTGVELGILGKIVEGLEVATKLQLGDLITRITISEK